MMHRHLLRIELDYEDDTELEIHHIDGNGLNNTRDNMQVVTKFSHRSMHKRRW